jgi:hypothetical protein
VFRAHNLKVTGARELENVKGKRAGVMGNAIDGICDSDAWIITRITACLCLCIYQPGSLPVCLSACLLI